MRMETGANQTLVAKKQALLRQIPAKAKLVAACIVVLSVNFLQSSQLALLAFLGAVCLLSVSGLSFRYVTKRLLAINAFFALLWLLLPLTLASKTSAQDALLFGPLAFEPEGIALALLLTLKGNAMAAVLLAMAGSSRMRENSRALLALRVPKKLVTMLVITYNNIARIEEEYERLFAAARLRGFVPRSKMAAYATYARLLGLLLVRSWQRSRRVDDAMALRSFCGRFPLFPLAAPYASGQNTHSFALPAFCTVFAAGLLFFDHIYLSGTV